ncbi:hypothetical protein [Cardinium endosymbiont of Sogatella furcifera]|uniref:hypothetical protein n=1 Tax=Cardinium endosymbiont of Sogatella furcifera TaxID=650378 RepID=UPI0013B39C32|nr:hypothetical protein [Cardinium endosymbiont of Sogatella furcifera]
MAHPARNVSISAIWQRYIPAGAKLRPCNTRCIRQGLSFYPLFYQEKNGIQSIINQ